MNVQTHQTAYIKYVQIWVYQLGFFKVIALSKVLLIHTKLYKLNNLFLGFIPGLGRFPGEGDGYPFQYSA